MTELKLDRRDALKAFAAGAAATMVPMFGARAAEKRPNIIFILADDHRYDAFGFMGKPWLKTPNMDRIAGEGVNFKNTFVTTSLCSPSRASFLTGQYVHCHGVTNNATPWHDSNVTFLELLHSAGYDTAFIGKWHMPGKGIPDLKAQGKVDRMVSFSYAGGQGRYEDCPLLVDGKKVEQKGYITDVLTDYSMEFLDKERDNPFCLYLSHKAMHAFFHPPERFKGALKDAPLPRLQEKDNNLPLGIVNEQQRAEFDKNVEGYYEALLAVDESVGRVLKLLDDRKIAENTMVVYAGDNGYFWGEHGLTDKRYAYEEGMRIPQLMRWPALVKDGGRECEGMVLNIDLAPSLMRAAGIEAPAVKKMQGMSFLDLAAGRQGEWRKSFLYEYFKDPGFPVPEIKAVRTEDWKLITYPEQSKKFPDEMYDLAKDPGEHVNLAADPSRADKKKELEAELTRLEKETAC